MKSINQIVKIVVIEKIKHFNSLRKEIIPVKEIIKTIKTFKK